MKKFCLSPTQSQQDDDTRAPTDDAYNVNIRFELRWQYASGDRFESVDAMLFLLLQAIHDGGSLRAAATECNVSYRNAWGIMQKWEQRFGAPVANLERGKGARLTPLGHKLLWGEQRINARLGPQLESLGSEISAEVRDLLNSGQLPDLRIFASHGLAVALLRDLALAGRRLKLDLQFRGSFESVRLLHAGKCDVAGFHLPEGKLGERLAPRIRSWLDSLDTALIHVVRRRQGLMMAATDPKGIRSIADLTKESVRFVNRQAGSGSRVTFDLLLADKGIEPGRIQGYGNEEFTHMAVAALVASDSADAGFGIEAVARQFKLHFVPVTWENYWFALKREQLTSPSLGALLALLRGAEFKDQVAGLSGYSASQAGSIVPLDSMLAFGQRHIV